MAVSSLAGEMFYSSLLSSEQKKNKWQQNPKELPFFSLQFPASFFQWRKAEQREMEKLREKTHFNLKMKKKPPQENKIPFEIKIKIILHFPV